MLTAFDTGDGPLVGTNLPSAETDYFTCPLSWDPPFANIIMPKLAHLSTYWLLGVTEHLTGRTLKDAGAEGRGRDEVAGGTHTQLQAIGSGPPGGHLGVMTHSDLPLPPIQSSQVLRRELLSTLHGRGTAWSCRWQSWQSWNTVHPLQPDPFPESYSLRKKIKASSLRDLSQGHIHASVIPLLPPLLLPSFVQVFIPRSMGMSVWLLISIIFLAIGIFQNISNTFLKVDSIHIVQGCQVRGLVTGALSWDRFWDQVQVLWERVQRLVPKHSGELQYKHFNSLKCNHWALYKFKERKKC